MIKPITAADFFDEFDSDVEFRDAQERIAPHTNLAINVLRLRRARGWTQTDLARAAGMKQPRIAEIERGDANPQLDTLVKIASALNVSPGSLLDGNDRGNTATGRVVRTRVFVYDPSDCGTVPWRDPMEQSPWAVASLDNFSLQA